MKLMVTMVLLLLILLLWSGTDWAWDDVHSQELTMGEWAEFKYTLSKNINDTSQAAKNQQKLYIKNPTSINALVINLYSLGFEGEKVQIDNVVLWKADGTTDTLETFNKKLPETEGNVSNGTCGNGNKWTYQNLWLANKDAFH